MTLPVCLSSALLVVNVLYKGIFIGSCKCRVAIRFKIIREINFAIIIAHRAIGKIMVMLSVSFIV